MLASCEDFLQVSIGSTPFRCTFEQNAAGALDLLRRQVRKVRRFLAEAQPGKSSDELLRAQRLKAGAPENSNGTSDPRTLLHRSGQRITTSAAKPSGARFRQLQAEVVRLGISWRSR